MKKGIFCCTKSILKALPWCPNLMTICLLHHSGEWYFAQETHKDTAVSVWACQAGFWKSTGTSCQLRSKPHAAFHGVCEIALTEVLATQMGVMRRSKKVSLFELYKFNPLSPHCGLIAWKLMHCYWVIQAGLLTPLTFARHRLSPLAAFISGAYFLHNGRWWQWIWEFYTANFKGIFGGP